MEGQETRYKCAEPECGRIIPKGRKKCPKCHSTNIIPVDEVQPTSPDEEPVTDDQDTEPVEDLGPVVVPDDAEPGDEFEHGRKKYLFRGYDDVGKKVYSEI